MGAVFSREADGTWSPSLLARGPFAGLQGGAVAGLLTAEIEALGREQRLGTATAVSAWFLRPAPMAGLRTAVQVLQAGGRVSVVDNTLFAVGKTEPIATARVTFVRERAVDVALPRDEAQGPPAEPERLATRVIAAPHGGQWFMDAMECRLGGDGVAWFRMSRPVVADAGVLATVLGPADWSHGIARPVHGAVADPNPDISVRLYRPPRDGWIGIRPAAAWRAESGIGIGHGVLLDVRGVIGSVAMSVALTPLRADAQQSGAA